jgi:O-antigen/teichoic acid export membrane protein
LLIVVYAKKLSPEIGFSFKHLKLEKFSEYYHYGKYVFAIKFADKVKVSLDNSVIAAFVGLSAVTHYTIAVTLVQYFGSLIGSIFGVISPALHKYHKLNQWDNLREVFLVTTEVTTLTSILVGGTLLTLGDQFILLWLGEGYDDAYIALVILCLAAIIINTQQPIELVLYAIAKHKYLAIITSIEAIANLVLSIVLAQYIGIYGVALGTTIPALFNTLILRPRYTCKQLSIPARAYYNILGKGIVLGLLIFIPGYFIAHMIEINNWITFILFGAILSASYALCYARLVMNQKTACYVIATVPQRLAPFVKFFTGAQKA